MNKTLKIHPLKGGIAVNLILIKYFKKLLQLIVFLIALSIVVFVLARLTPGDPLTAYYGDALDRMSMEQKNAAIIRLSLDRPIAEQYLTWAKNVLHGDFGISYMYKRPVNSVIGDLWPNTLILSGLSYLLTFILSTLLALFCARHEGSFIDTVICKLGTISSLIPTFFIALMCILIFSVNLKIMPTSGAYSIGHKNDFIDRMLHLILPLFTLTITHLWYYAYMLRNKLIDELNKDYILLLRIKRLSTSKILYRHCLRNCLPALITIMSISVPHIISGTYIVELVFSYPGLGTLAFESAQYKDYNMLSIITLLTGFAVIVTSIIGQELSAWLDPAMAHENTQRAKGGQ